jgi:hypothetical protein
LVVVALSFPFAFSATDAQLRRGQNPVRPAPVAAPGGRITAPGAEMTSQVRASESRAEACTFGG